MLTQQQSKLLGYITDYQKNESHSPSYEQMMRFMGLKSKSGIHRLILGLEKRGFVKRIPGHARAIEVVPIEADIRDFEEGSLSLNPEANAIDIFDTHGRLALRLPRATIIEMFALMREYEINKKKGEAA